MVQTVAASCRSLHQLLGKTKRPRDRFSRGRLFHTLGAHHLGMKIELQLRRGFSARWRVFPIP